jgi:hypothetical protein
MYITQWASSVRGELANMSNIEKVEAVETGGAAAFGRRNGTNNQLLLALFETKVVWWMCFHLRSLGISLEHPR